MCTEQVAPLDFIEEAENRIEMLRTAVSEITDTNLAQGSDIRALLEFANETVDIVNTMDARLEELAEKTAQGLAHLAVAIVELKKPTLRDRLAALFRANIYDGRPT